MREKSMRATEGKQDEEKKQLKDQQKKNEKDQD